MSDEYFDILNPDGTSAGYSFPRSRVHREGLWHRSAHIWVCDRHGRILLQRRALDKDTHPGLWDISAAGHLSAGEPSIDAAVREIREELGLVIPPSRIIFRFTDREEHSGATITDREFHDVFTLVVTDEEAEMIRPDPVELCDIRWLTVDEFGRELSASPELFVPHSAEYRWVSEEMLK
ncbi:MAG TPA: NUDIX domain-containing protein [Spirochaetota bacterium]|nr:NUDIX domain-containing protein [Spirochaetota bacterium]